MKRMLAILLTLSLPLCCCFGAAAGEGEEGWIRLFDGKTLAGWKVGENAGSFRVEEGVLVVHGPRAHLFYVGDVKNHDFKDFHFKAEVMTTAGSNSGLYFHTRFQEGGWPEIGYEVQVNQTHSDPKKSSGLYGISDVLAAPAKDDEWYTQEIIVRGKRIITKVNGKTLVDFTEPDGVRGPRKLSSGTFAVQAHDPKSKVYVRNIVVQPL